MVPSICTTGARAHWPKQATVRTEAKPSTVVTELASSSRKPSMPEALQARLEELERAAGMAGGAAADDNRVEALRRQVENE